MQLIFSFDNDSFSTTKKTSITSTTTNRRRKNAVGCRPTEGQFSEASVQRNAVFAELSAPHLLRPSIERSFSEGQYPSQRTNTRIATDGLFRLERYALRRSSDGQLPPQSVARKRSETSSSDQSDAFAFDSPDVSFSGYLGGKQQQQQQQQKQQQQQQQQQQQKQQQQPKISQINSLLVRVQVLSDGGHESAETL